MTDLRFEAALRAARAKAPSGMGDFSLREIVRAALAAADRFAVENNVEGAVAVLVDHDMQEEANELLRRVAARR